MLAPFETVERAKDLVHGKNVDAVLHGWRVATAKEHDMSFVRVNELPEAIELAVVDGVVKQRRRDLGEDALAVGCDADEIHGFEGAANRQKERLKARQAKSRRVGQPKKLATTNLLPGRREQAPRQRLHSLLDNRGHGVADCVPTGNSALPWTTGSDNGVVAWMKCLGVRKLNGLECRDALTRTPIASE